MCVSAGVRAARAGVAGVQLGRGRRRAVAGGPHAADEGHVDLAPVPPHLPHTYPPNIFIDNAFIVCHGYHKQENYGYRRTALNTIICSVSYFAETLA